MLTCEGPCGLDLPDRLVFTCDKHCDKKLCIRCIQKHAAEVTLTFRQIPQMMKATK